MLKWISITVGLLVVVVAGLIAAAWTPDIPQDVLIKKYTTPASAFIALPSGARAHYRIEGNPHGPTLVLLHGSNSSLQTWEPWVAELKDAYRIVTVDEPGHGLTGPVPSDDYTYGGLADFVKEFTDTLQLGRFFLGGNSMGGGVALTYATRYQDSLRGLILIDAAGLATPAHTRIKVDRPLVFDLAGSWYADWIIEHVTPRSLVKEGLDKAFVDKSRITEKMIDRYWELSRAPGNRRATGLRFASYRKGPPDLKLEDIHVPTLILWGAEDRLIPEESGAEMHKRIAGSDFIVFPNVGHVMMEETPARSAATVRAFIDRIAPPAPALGRHSGHLEKTG
ncbi:alpha/beta fold hydrolase [Kordiimonas marina]|uniref:alpha/beta fold hydrolase n=1 Tax=Kordiimonas marina TaxID=2872312 RepID=UPI001FF6F7FF|nr:alpha/beta hydrolase [Kordiimonas marina]MCJ9429107.1 alpha/beta hydrolase [Kordiimonas marina]